MNVCYVDTLVDNLVNDARICIKLSFFSEDFVISRFIVSKRCFAAFFQITYVLTALGKIIIYQKQIHNLGNCL